MGLYHIKLPEDAKTFVEAGHDVMIVVAESVAEAKKVAQASVNLPSDAAWNAATVTAITEGADLEGWRARISIYDTGSALVEQVTVTAVAADDFDDIGGDLATALNATASIAAAAYATPNLTVAAAGDSLGDHTVVCEFFPPTTWDDPTIDFPALYGTITHEGVAGAALAVVLNDVVQPELKYQLGS